MRKKHSYKLTLMRGLFLSLVFLLILFSGLTQKKVSKLPPELAESSALIKYQDLFLTINDSGNEPIVYIFNIKGKIIHECYIKDAQNEDWEALTYDGKDFLYIGDIGNNANKRKDLAVYKVKIKDIMEQDTSASSKISFSYPEQNQFPPIASELYYDAEAMIYRDNQLIIFTKNRTAPFDGISKVYSLPTKSGEYKAMYIDDFKLPATHWLEDSITDANFFDGKLYLLTYSKIYVYNWTGKIYEKEEEIKHEFITQKEGIAVDEKYIYMVDENNSTLSKGNFLYKIRH